MARALGHEGRRARHATRLFFGLPGVIVGPFVGAVIGELTAHRDVAKAGKAGLAASVQFAIGTAVKVAMAFLIIGIFLVALIFWLQESITHRAVQPTQSGVLMSRYADADGPLPSSQLLPWARWGARCRNPTIVTSPPEKFTMRVVTSGLDGPWEIAWGPDQQIWATERRGRRVIRINPADGTRTTLLTLHEVHQSVSQDGLLGLALHPDLLKALVGSNDVYVAFTYDDAPGPALARRMGIRRYQYDANTRTLSKAMDVIMGLPTHDDHVGGRLAIGRDLKLYLTIGDQGSNFGANRCNANHAQNLPTMTQVSARDWSNYQGKILRINLDKSIPDDNPAINGVRSHVFSYGHRNPLGLVVGPKGEIYESEHGPNTDDEVNLIEGGRNYGWPNVAGYRDGKTYVYANWSASKPTPCAALPPGTQSPVQSTRQAEMAWNNERFAPRFARSSRSRPATTRRASAAPRWRPAESTSICRARFQPGAIHCSRSA